ncbi:hypothetical protein B9Z55_024078 [Caenorhabditis nigoni]|nr:hypothetical protein B9Z55_024078 [Caenorhabditis nigoni]
MTPTDRSNEEQVPFVNRSSTSFFPPQLSTSESEKSESTIPQRVGRKLFILFGIPITIVLLIIGIMELLGLYGRHNDMHNLFAPRIQFQRNGDADEVDENIPLIDFEA